MKNKKIIFLICFSFHMFSSFGQESVNTAGESVRNNTGSVSYSVGQVVYNYNTGEKGNTQQGVQQVYQITLVGFEEKSLDISLSVYPNPTSDILLLELDDMNYDEIQVQIINSNGSILQNQPVIRNKEKFDLSSYESGIYFIKVQGYSKEIKTFKIVKN